MLDCFLVEFLLFYDCSTLWLDGKGKGIKDNFLFKNGEVFFSESN
jgi:hypothetical protein